MAFKRINRAADICREIGISLPTFYRLLVLPEDDPKRFPQADVRQGKNDQLPGWTDSTCEAYVVTQVERELASKAASKLHKRCHSARALLATTR